MDIRARRHDPEVELLARQIFENFPRCMKCGETIASFDEADIRILSHRVVHRRECQPILPTRDPRTDETS